MTRLHSALRAILPVVLCLFISAPVVMAETVKARVLEVNEKRSEVKVDVAGQGRVYRVDDRSLYATLRPGRLVVITAEFVNGRHTIVDAKRAAQDGRVVSVDEREASAQITDSDTRTTDTYYFETGRLPRVGETVSFDVEERARRKVITRWNPLGGGGDGMGGGGGSGGGGGRPQTLSDRGRVIEINRSRTEVTIALASYNRDERFEVLDRRLLDGVQSGDRVTFEFERRGGGRLVIVSLR